MSATLELRFWIASDSDGLGATAARVLKSCNSKRGAPTGGDSNHHVLLGRLTLRHLGTAQFPRVLAGFRFGAQGLRSAGDEELHQLGRGRERGRDFRGIERADASARPSADIKQASALAEVRGDQVNGSGNLREGAPDGGSNLRIFGIDDARDFER